MATTIQKTSAYGTWKSPIAPDLLANADNSPIDCFAHLGLGNTVFYYLEGRASKGGRQVIVRDVDGVQEDILSSEFSAQSKIHEYGGSAFTLVKDGRLIFVNGNSQAIYYLSPQTKKTSLLYADSKGRFADFDQIVIKNDETMIVAVHEEPERQYNELVLLDPSDQTIITTISGADFYTTPRFSPDGRWLFWLQWNLEDMP